MMQNEMPSFSRSCFLVRLVLMTTVAGLVSPPLCADKTEPVLEKINKAKSLINQEEYERALVTLTEAFALEPSSKIMFNIAMCEKALNRHTDAVVSFRRFQALEQNDPSDSAVMSDLAEEALNELLSLVASVRIVDAPDDADVRIDGRHLGTASLRDPLYLMPGNHTVTVTKDDFAPIEIDITAVGGAALTVRADLKSALSGIFVTCSVPNGQVSIDGENKGTCSYEGDLLPGLHVVTISAPGKRTAVHRVMAEARRTTVLDVDLQPTVPMTAPVQVSPVSSKHRWAAPAAGAILMSLGAAGVGLGAYSHYKWQAEVDNANQKGAEIAAELDSRAETTENDYDNMGGAYEAYARSTLNSVENKKDMIIGYAVGGALAAAGIGFLIYHYSIKKQEQAHVAVSVNTSGIEIKF